MTELQWISGCSDDRRDQQADLQDGYWAQVGPEYPNSWSCIILRTDNLTGQTDEVLAITVRTEQDAKAYAAGWYDFTHKSSIW